MAVDVDAIVVGQRRNNGEQWGYVMPTAAKIDDADRETILKVVDNYLTSAQLQTTSKKLKQKV